MATHAHTTTALRRRRHRRATGGPLLAAVARFHTTHAAVLKVEADAQAPWEKVETASRAWNRAAAALCALPPRNAGELARKAFAVALVLRATVGNATEPASFDVSAGLHERLALALTRDILAMQARAS